MRIEPPTTTKAAAESLVAAIAVTAIVPARDEEQVIAACVEALARQPEIAQILVINDQSTDKTAEIVRGLTAEIPQLRLMETRDVPPGWVGKNNAVWLGSQKAKSGWLLFTDADAELAPEAVSRAVQITRETGAALVSFSPEQLEIGRASCRERV
jgi:cellulose synthase/poly-beta-1,6-N-acetylglucosamine synthase-like glycosyltransferase